MKLFRNPEIKKTIFLCTLIDTPFTVAAFIWEWYFGIFTLALCCLITAAYLAGESRRYKRISELANDVDHILHGDTKIDIDKYSEGELAVLQSEIYKMTVRLREQQQSLQEDKVYLADSIADISHQIRTPLTSINLLISLISEPDITNERRQKLSHDLYDMLSRIDWLITALLKISKLDAGTVRFTRETIQLNELLNRAVGPLLVPMDLRNQVLKMSAEGVFSGDVAWTCEAIANIVKNCMEHTPTNGRIEIAATENALYSEIVIRDNGSGISRDDLPHIFERFYKGENSDDKSFGIGLSLSRMIITAQNGTVKAENIVPNGTKFVIRFYKGTV